jgi:hypothetical protein
LNLPSALARFAGIPSGAEFFDAFNTPQVDNPAVDFGAPGFVKTTATKVAPRIVQLALKYCF